MKLSAPHLTKTLSTVSPHVLELGCLAASPAAIRAAIDNGADWVRIPYRLPSIAFTNEKRDSRSNRLGNAVRYVHDKGRKLVLDMSVSPTSVAWPNLCEALCIARDAGIDAVVLSDPALALYTSIHYSDLPLHFATSSALSNITTTHLKLQLGVSRILLPRSISLAQVEQVATCTNSELEVWGFSHDNLLAAPCLATAIFPTGSASRQKHIGKCNPESPWGHYVCTDDEIACNDTCYSSGRLARRVLRQLPRLAALGIRAIQVEPGINTPSAVAQVTKVWRAAIDQCIEDTEHFRVNPAWTMQLETLHGPQ